MQKILEHALPWVSLLLILGIVFELVGGLLIFLSLNIRLGAFLLLIFLILTTLFFHHFWYLQGTDYDLQLSMFLKNLSIFGGLLIVLTYGKGKNKTVKNSEKKN